MADFRDKVEFRTVSKVYPTDAHVECNYLLKASHKPSSYDWIGLFRVGWSTNKDVIFYHWAPYPKQRKEDEECQGSVLFHAQNLPGEDGEFYQFVYFNDKNKMCGASTPFQFRAPRNDDLIEQEVEGEMLLITTNQLVLEEKLRKVERDRESLLQTCEDGKVEIELLMKHLRDEEVQLSDIKQEKCLLLERVQICQSELEELQERHAGEIAVKDQLCQDRQLEIERLQTELAQITSQYEKQEADCVQLRNEFDRRAGEVDSLKNELEMVKLHCSRVEMDRQQAMSDSQVTSSELEQLKRKLVKDVSEREALDTLQAQYNSSQETIEALETHINQQKNVIETSAAKQLVLDTEISTLKETLSSMSEKVQQVNTESHDMKTMLARETEISQAEISGLRDTITQLSHEKNSLASTITKLDREIAQVRLEAANRDEFDAQEDKYVALQTAYAMVKDELSCSDAELSKLKRKDMKREKQIHDLQMKLKSGEEEWRKVYQEKCEAERKLRRSTSRLSLSEEKIPNVPLTSSQKETSSELTRDELIKMVEQLTTDLEQRMVKKERYKSKYQDEKQRVATLRDDHARELDTLRKDLELARAQLDEQLSVSALRTNRAPAVSGSSLITVQPIVYPPLTRSNPTASTPASVTSHASVASKDVGGAKPKMDGLSVFPRQNNQSGDGLGALEQSLQESLCLPDPMRPIPAPARVNAHATARGGAIDGTAGIAAGGTAVAGTAAGGTAAADTAAGVAPQEVAVVTRADSDDENEGAERFHDASSDLTNLVKCCVCGKVFDNFESVEARNAHVSEHLEQETDQCYSCPICNKKFRKDEWTNVQVERHVNDHFTIID